MRPTIDLGIVEDNVVSDKIAEAAGRWTGLTRAWEGITWAILQDFELGECLNEEGTRRLLVVEGVLDLDEPTVWLIYEKTAFNQITLREVDFLDATHAVSGSA